MEIHGLGNLETSRSTHWFAHVVSTPFWEMGRGAVSASTKLFWVPYETLQFFDLHLKISWKFEIIFWSLSRGEFQGLLKVCPKRLSASMNVEIEVQQQAWLEFGPQWFLKQTKNFKLVGKKKTTRSDTAHFGTNSSEIHLKEIKCLGSSARHTFLFRKMCLGCQAFGTCSATIFLHVFANGPSSALIG